ncbi:uncharacterized protein M421DRAFT_412646 [Didymella exigua CBS 183.55]|uniref:Uncharacterized protein n=1 Tax=Didymella exigua CBS 183.55 TaxID=1150837 RepID=A0A6A5RTT9_9PLEO|nr:uncharacterized protein M421DRAFT_412646 [Didymella exigua CBS 183.55]KAF1930438.1 hypothetical protein M421DRAFT_412646 [Didymella exigua CBS 183.55]
MNSFLHSAEAISRECIPPLTGIARRWSSPSAPLDWQTHNKRWADDIFQDYTTSSGTDADEQNKACRELQNLTQNCLDHFYVQETPHCFMACSHDVCEAYMISHLNDNRVREHACSQCTKSAPRVTVGNTETRPRPSDNARLGQYSREIYGMMQGAVYDLMSSGRIEPFPAYTEIEYIEGICPFSSEHEHIASATELNSHTANRPRGNRPPPSEFVSTIPVTRTSSIDVQSLADKVPSPLGDGSPSSGSHTIISTQPSTRPSTQPSSVDLSATRRQTADSLGGRRVRRMESCYFGVSEDQTDTNGESLISRMACNLRDG